ADHGRQRRAEKGTLHTLPRRHPYGFARRTQRHEAACQNEEEITRSRGEGIGRTRGAAREARNQALAGCRAPMVGSPRAPRVRVILLPLYRHTAFVPLCSSCEILIRADGWSGELMG